jgi:hypothetical protein
MAELWTLRNRVREAWINFFWNLAHGGYHHLVVQARVVPLLVQFFETFDEVEMSTALSIFEILSANPNSQQHVLTSRVLPLFRPNLIHFLKVSGRVRKY